MAFFWQKNEKEESEKAAGLKIDISTSGTELVVKLKGRLDTLTSPDLEDKLEESLGGVKRLVFDVEKLGYISSAGLRVLLGASQQMSEANGEMVIRNVTDTVKSVFDLTGFSSAFNIE